MIINPDTIKISNELGTDVSEHFDISLGSDNTVTAAATSDALKAVDFYSHIYTLRINAVIKEGAGLSKNIISNNAVTLLNQTEYKSNTVKTNLIFRIDTAITNGTITPSINSIAGGESKSIEFTPDKDC